MKAAAPQNVIATKKAAVCESRCAMEPCKADCDNFWPRRRVPKQRMTEMKTTKIILCHRMMARARKGHLQQSQNHPVDLKSGRSIELHRKELSEIAASSCGRKPKEAKRQNPLSINHPVQQDDLPLIWSNHKMILVASSSHPVLGTCLGLGRA